MNELVNELANPVITPASEPLHAVVIKTEPRRVIQLDFLRGVAILLVLGSHGTTLILPENAGRFRPLAEFFERFGWTGVDLFFVLSGFLVGGLLLRELKKQGTLNIRRFIIRRGLKIWPTYFVFLGWLILQSLRAHHSLSAAIHPLLPNLLHIQNYVYMTQEFTWSLAVEEHFYLLLPLVLWLLTRRQERNRLALFPFLFAIIAVFCLLMRFQAQIQYPWHSGIPITWDWKVFMPTHLRMDGLMFGVLLAYFTHFRPQVLDAVARSSKRRWFLLAGGLALISPMLFCSRSEAHWVVPVYTLGVTLLYLGYGCILVACVYTKTAAGTPGKLFQTKMAKVIAGIGFYSYPIYLWHINQGRDRALHYLHAGKFAHLGETSRWFVTISLYMACAIVFGIVFSRILEMPVLALRERLFPEPARK
ncbi:MAG: acyltransferase 3 [Chthonomonadaceae bacterium]|nr:acyltransferase 3 [Chthonomonadaceae bacterium]